MSPEQITLVRDSFAKVVPIAPAAAAMFYDRLFALDPDLRPLFKGDMAEQGRKLMAMIGAFLGWQAAIIVFFIAPCVGAVFGILQWLLIRENILPYGPFLCLGGLITVIFWSPLWTQASEMFEVPWLVPSAIVVCLPLLAGLLYGLRLLKIRFGGAGE